MTVKKMKNFYTSFNILMLYIFLYVVFFQNEITLRLEYGLNRWPIIYIYITFRKEKHWERQRKKWPVTIAVRPLPSIPWVTSLAVEYDENPEAPILLNGHPIVCLFFSFLFLCSSNSVFLSSNRLQEI